jgi:hypothetical protein
MPIRREDKEFIQALSLLGAVFGACIGLIVVMHFSDQAHESHYEQTEYVQTQAALLKLQTTVVNPNNPIADEHVLSQVQKQMDQTPAPEPVVKKNFWVRMSRFGFATLCTGGCVIGAVTGYSSVWLIGWIGSLLVLYSIRLLYLMIRSVAPGVIAAKSEVAAGQLPGNNTGAKRDDGRILPTLIKLIFLLAFTLSIIAAIAWHLTKI